MMKTIAPKDMMALEKAFMREYGVPGSLLMEHAAQAVCDVLAELVPGKTVLFLCGPGNNGGDGYAAARLWQQAGGQSHVMEMNDSPTGDAGLNRRLCLLHGIDPRPISPSFPPCDAVVDALFGTGLDKPVEGPIAHVVYSVNHSGVPVVAVDIPSGLHGGTGEALGEVVHADVTVTFHRVKTGLLLRDGPDYTGRIVCSPILIPADYGHTPGLSCLEERDIPRLLPPRPRTGHKGTFGKVVIFAGSMGMAGAAALCAQAAIKTGAGLTYLLCRASILPMLQVMAPGAVCVPLPEEHGRLTPDAAQIAANALATADAAAVGCGLSQAEDALPVLQAFTRAACPVVWDADALNLLASHGEMLHVPDYAVLTPHPGEAARLLHSTLHEVLQAPEEALQALQRQYGCTVLLKGARSLMADSLSTAVNLYGTPAMGKGGSGDVLTGMLAALLARKLPATRLEVTQLAAMLHGMAGLRAEAQLGENCVTPQDLLQAIKA